MEGKKDDTGKLPWFDLPMELVELLVPVATAGREKYGLHSALNILDNGNERWFGASMRHHKECQKDPLAIDPEDGCYHLAKSAYSDLARLYQALQLRTLPEEVRTFGYRSKPLPEDHPGITGRLESKEFALRTIGGGGLCRISNNENSGCAPIDVNYMEETTCHCDYDLEAAATELAFRNDE